MTDDHPYPELCQAAGCSLTSPNMAVPNDRRGQAEWLAARLQRVAGLTVPAAEVEALAADWWSQVQSAPGSTRTLRL